MRMSGNLSLPPIAGGNSVVSGGGSLAASLPARPSSRCSSRPSSGSSTTTSYIASNRTSNPNPTEYCVFRDGLGPPTRSRPTNGRLPSLKSRGHGRMTSSGYYKSPRSAGLQRAGSEECLKCLLKVPHTKCEAHKYLRVGGGYRHSYWYVKAMLEEIELQRQRAELQRQRLEAIQEKQIHAIKTYIRTKSGRLVERVLFLSEEDYQAFKAGNKDIAGDILKKYLSQDEAQGLVSWDKDEQKAITTFVRTKSGRLVERTVYVSKDDYEKMKKGEVDANTLLKKYLKMSDGEALEGWGEAEMKKITTYVRTKSGRLVEKTILVSKADYDKLQQMMKEGGDPEAMAKLLGNYMSVNDGEKIEGFKKEESAPMKVVKTMVRTKSGRLVEKTLLMTEDEYNQFLETGGDVNFLKKFLNLDKDDVIENWEKASTVFSASDDDMIEKGIPGTRVVGKDGQVYEIVVDPITGKKYKKKVGGKESDIDSGFASMNQVKKLGRKGKTTLGAIGTEDPHEAGMSKEQVASYRAGNRRDGSASDYSYRSVVSAGGTRHVKRRRRREDGTYSDEESYHSDQDEAGKKRRQNRRQQRKAQAVKEAKKKYEQGRRNAGSDSDYSYRSVVSAGGTRHVKRRKKLADGTYGDDESYHSSQDEEGQKRRKKRRQKKVEAIRQGKRDAGSDSDFSYRSFVSAGGTRHVKRKKKLPGGKYGDEESYHSSQDEDGRDRRRKRRAGRQKNYKKGKRRDDSDSDYSYRSVVSAGGTRHVKRRKKLADGTYGDEESYHSSQDEDGEARRRRRRRDRKHAGSAHSYYSVVSDGGTRHVRRKKKRADGTYSASESYHSGDSDFFDDKKLKRRKKRREHGSDSDYSYTSEVSAGGTRRRTRTKRIRDKHGKVIGHGKAEAYTSPSEYETDTDASSYEMKPDGKGGFKKVKKEKKGKGGKGGKKKGGGPDDMTDFSGSLQSTDSENEPDLSKMTEKERKEYLEAKAKRKAEREKKRREKYGDKYDEMMDKHKKAKEAVKKAKSMVTYEKGGKGRLGEDGMDNRGIGLAHDEWGSAQKKGKKKGGKGGKDGSEADDEMENYEDEFGNIRRRKKKQDDEESLYEYARDDEGNILLDKHGKPIMKKVGYVKKGRKGKDGIVDSDEEFEYRYDEHGNLVRKKKEEKEDDGNYFDTLPDGTIKLRAGKKKIDLSKLSADDLKKLGIDLKTMTKEEIARILKDKFGEDIQILRAGKKIGLKHADEMEGANTDEMADDSDLDTSTLKGQRRVRVLMKKGGQAIMEHLKKVIQTSYLVDPEKAHPDERDAHINFLQHYRLVDNSKLDMYARAFVVEDDDLDCVVYPREARRALEGVPSVTDISQKQMEYILKLLDIDKETNITFRMFAVMVALSERITKMDTHCKHLLEVCNLTDIERKMELFRAMFYCNVAGDRDANYIKAESLRIELMAGGLSWQQQDYIMTKMSPNEWREISFLDYLAYIPLFLSMHDKVCDNPLDMSSSKYGDRPASPQRDMNPLGFHLKKDSPFIKENIRAADLKERAAQLLSGKKHQPDDDVTDFYQKYTKLPQIGSQSTPGTSKPRKGVF